MLLLLFPTLLLQQLLDLLLLLQLLYVAYDAAALTAAWPRTVATLPLGVAPEAMQLLHVMNSC